jgi:hypothetical protein
VQQDRITRRAEIAYIVLILAVVVWREAEPASAGALRRARPENVPIWVSYGPAALAVAMPRARRARKGARPRRRAR